MTFSCYWSCLYRLRLGASVDLPELPGAQVAGSEGRRPIEGHPGVQRHGQLPRREARGHAVQMADQDAEIEPVPTTGGGRKPEPELDRLSNILEEFTDQFGKIPWDDADRAHKLVTEEIPAKVAAYQNAKKQGDKGKARIEHDAPLPMRRIGYVTLSPITFKKQRRGQAISPFRTSIPQHSTAGGFCNCRCKTIFAFRERYLSPSRLAEWRGRGVPRPARAQKKMAPPRPPHATDPGRFACSIRRQRVWGHPAQGKS